MDERKKQKFTLEHLFQPKTPTILTEFSARSPSSSSDYNSDSDCDASKLLEVDKNQITVSCKASFTAKYGKNNMVVF
jgi:hypothetical protein